MESPARIDLYVERRTTVVDLARQPGHVTLFDRDDMEQDPGASRVFETDARAFFRELMRGCWLGTMRPRRFIARGESGALLTNAPAVVHQFVVPAMLLADGSPEFCREAFNRSRFLRAERQAAVDALLARALGAFDGLNGGAPDLGAVVEFHGDLLAAVWGGFREACSLLSVEYDLSTEAEYRACYQRELGPAVPSLD